MSKLALQRIAENKKTRATTLDLGNCGLTELPPQALDCVWLETLILSQSWWLFHRYYAKSCLKTFSNMANNLGWRFSNN